MPHATCARPVVCRAPTEARAAYRWPRRREARPARLRAYSLSIRNIFITNYYVARRSFAQCPPARPLVPPCCQWTVLSVLLPRLGFRRGVRGGEHGAKLAEEPATWRKPVSLCLRAMERSAILSRHVTSSSRMIVMLRKTHRCIRMSCAPYGERACGTAETERWGVGLECWRAARSRHAHWIFDVVEHAQQREDQAEQRELERRDDACARRAP